MMTKNTYCAVLLCCILYMVLSASLFAQLPTRADDWTPYDFHQQGTFAISTGGAYVGLAHRPDTLIINPAGISQIEYPTLILNLDTAFAYNNLRNWDVFVDFKRPSVIGFILPTTNKNNPMTYGIGIFTVFQRAVIPEHRRIAVYNTAPTLACTLSRRLSLGIQPGLAIANYEGTHTFGTGFIGRAGMLYHISPLVHVGMSGQLPLIIKWDNNYAFPQLTDERFPGRMQSGICFNFKRPTAAQQYNTYLTQKAAGEHPNTTIVKIDKLTFDVEYQSWNDIQLGPLTAETIFNGRLKNTIGEQLQLHGGIVLYISEVAVKETYIWEGKEILPQSTEETEYYRQWGQKIIRTNLNQTLLRFGLMSQLDTGLTADNSYYQHKPQIYFTIGWGATAFKVIHFDAAIYDSLIPSLFYSANEAIEGAHITAMYEFGKKAGIEEKDPIAEKRKARADYDAIEERIRQLTHDIQPLQQEEQELQERCIKLSNERKYYQETGASETLIKNRTQNILLINKRIAENHSKQNVVYEQHRQALRDLRTAGLQLQELGETRRIPTLEEIEAFPNSPENTATTEIIDTEKSFDEHNTTDTQSHDDQQSKEMINRDENVPVPIQSDTQETEAPNEETE